MKDQKDNIYKFILFVTYLSAFISLIFVGFNLYMFKYTHSIIWLIFAILFAISGIKDLAENDDDVYDEISKR